MAGNFSGTYEHNLDSKNRLFVPADFKPIIDGRITIRLSISEYPHIDCFKEEDFEDVVKKEVEKELERARKNDDIELPADDLDSISRLYAKTVSIDNGGRICIPSKLLEKSGISKESIFVGKGDFFQIWNPDTHDEYNDNLREIYLERKMAENAERRMRNKYRSEGKFLDLKNTLGSE